LFSFGLKGSPTPKRPSRRLVAVDINIETLESKMTTGHDLGSINNEDSNQKDDNRNSGASFI